MPNPDPRIDEYIARSATFARPILEHLRRLAHEACPKVEETIKWNFPTFLYHGKILCHMASFKQHCSFGFWKASLMSDPHKILQLTNKSAMGSFGKITDISILPDEEIIRSYIREAAKINET